ncbi:hypothetical protein KPP03845_200007 (plasmid) [Streptomyces xanthophaeus]|uniref:hypothetical protein n=1 Tax=Streptomyces xanthophaeus TaxID=67385 RepID=UPI003867FF21|nr:hypothetical protein KPP03845_200007 [Streptomyces xanthophaeus]
MTDNGPLRTEFDFELPQGYVDDKGTVHRRGRMRLATAQDEQAPLRDARVKANPAYLTIILLSLVITRLGTVPKIHVGVVESLFAADLAYLQDFYRKINRLEDHGGAAPESVPGGGLGEA